MVTKFEIAIDICAGNHGGNEQSRQANKRSSRVRAEQPRAVYNLLRQYPKTMKEVAALMGAQLNRISGRASELLRGGYLKDTGIRRDGARVLAVTDLEF